MTDLTELKELDSLSEEEKKYALQILRELSQKGSSEKFNNLLYDDYEEIPVDIETFLHEKQYLGKALINEEGKFTLFPYWEETLKKIFPTNIDTAYNTAIFTGAIGIGKSLVSVIAVIYQLYRMMCLKNPYLHYGLQDIDLITFAFINITLDAAKGVAWDKCQQMLQRSSWFMERGRMTKGDYPQWVPPKGIELITGSTTNHMIGRAIFACFIDEVSFQPNKDVEQQIAKAKKLVNTANTRMQSRFMKGEKNPTILLLASSKRTEQSYLETFIAEKKKNNSKTTLIVDEPQWVIRTDKDSKEKFKVAVGNKYLTSELLPLNISENEVQLYRERGFDILEVPMGYREAFEDDLDQSLMDTAGISVSVISKFISGPRLLAIKDANLKNPFRSNILVIGNNPEDKEQYYDHFDLSLVDVKQREKPLFVHMDMSISGDKTGICGIWITGKHPPEDNKTTADELYYQLAFIVSIKAPKGYQISFEKNRQFIYWLRDQGFNVKGVSTDSFQSVDTSQSLISHNFNYTQISVDRLTNKVCEPYQYLRTIIYEKRLKIPVDVDLLFEELIGLERDNNTGKIDHSAASINCLSGDTSISLVDGREISIENLVSEFQEGKENFVYTFNETSKKIEAKRIINAFCSGYTNQLIRVTLDNNQSFLCTPEHRIMLRNGVYCEAKDLCLDDSLMPLKKQILHKVLTFEQINLNNSIPVYDLTIEDNHNFALSCGIFVHNSKDSADALAGSIYNASKHGDEFAFNFGETLDSIQEANLDLDNFTDDTVKFEEALKSKMTQRIKKEDKSPFMDFGMGPAQEYTSQSLAEGILVW